MARQILFVVTALVVIGIASPVGAQPRAARADSVPASYRPPSGMCRVWVEGVPATQQPAPTDCASAVRNKPTNAKVIYGEDPQAGRKRPSLPIKGFNQQSQEKKLPPLVPPDIAEMDPRLIRANWERKQISDQQLFGDRPAYPPALSYPGSALSPYGPQGSYGGAIGPNGYPLPNGGVGPNGYPVPYGAVGPNGYPMNGYAPNVYPPNAYPPNPYAAPNVYVGPSGAAVGVGPVTDPRYFTTNPNVKPPGYGSATCLDRDGDGWCDDQRFGPSTCLDQDKDGRCDDLPGFSSQAYPQTLPHMHSVLDVLQGRTNTEVMVWLGTNEFTLRVPVLGRGGTPWRAIFLDQTGQLLQVWTDLNRDGLADRVEIFRNGKRVKLLQR